MPDAERLRKHAQECRELAKIAPDDRFRDTLARIAAALEEDAEEVERERG